MANITVGVLARSAGYAGIASFWQITSRIVLAPVVLAKIGLEGYGVWALLFSLTGSVNLVGANFGLAYAKFTAEYDARRDYAGLNELLGSNSHEASDSIKIKAPDIAENGAVVPVTVDTSISGVESISIFASKNANPLTSSYNLGANTSPFISTRVKMGKTSDVVAVVKAGGKLYSAKKEVKVTIGGCGG